MRLGIGSYTFAWAIGVPGSLPDHPLDAFGLLERAVQADIGIVQIADNLPLHRLPQTTLEDLARRATESNIQIEVGTRGIGSENLETYLQIASLFSSPFLRVVVDTADDHPMPEAIIERLRVFIPAFEKAGIQLAIENHDRFMVDTLRGIIKTLDSPWIGICLDTVNSFGSLENPAMVVEALGPYVINLHVKDFSIRRVSHQMGFVVEGEPAGKGRLDVPWLIRSLSQMGRDPNAILELWTPPEKTIAETIAKEAAWAAESIPYLRTLIPQ